MDKAGSQVNDPLEIATAFASDTHAHMQKTISLADQKAGFLFGVVTAILAYLHTSGATQRFIQDLRHGQWPFQQVLVGVAVVGLVAGAIFALLVVIPRAPKAVRGLVASWGIAEFPSAQDYVNEVLKSDPAALARAKLEYCWILSRISRRKYFFINNALRCSFVGLVAALAYLAVG